VGKYSGILRDLILKFKEMDCLKYSLGDLLLEIVEKNIGVQGFDLLVAVPLSKKREFSRGYNQSNLMAEVIGKKLNKPVVKNNLIRIRDTKPQFKLSRNERILNLKDAFRIKSPEAFKKKNIVIVDDVTTTCTTFEECARQLKNSGAGKIYCAALARD